MEHIVTIKEMVYDPETLTVNKGDTVVWHNANGMSHTATRIDTPAFDTGKITPGNSSIAIKFNKTSGSTGYVYFCKPHPFMTAKIIVQ